MQSQCNIIALQCFIALQCCEVMMNDEPMNPCIIFTATHGTFRIHKS